MISLLFQIYLYLPGEVFRVTPVLVLSSFPLAQNVIFPLAMMYPNYLLSTHFYTDEQKMSSFLNDAKSKQSYYVSVFRDLQRSTPNDKFKAEKDVLKEIFRQQDMPQASKILKLRPLFDKGGPLYISELKATHVKHLMKINGVRGSLLWFPRFRLQQYANLVHEIDGAILREEFHMEHSMELARACNLRGLNVASQSDDQLYEYLEKWIEITDKLTIYEMSMLLHLPILLGYNHASRIWDGSKSVH